eukprot:TRINITY_DN809_c0_g1_i1.p1 TRINITY_DN809_c0_g1~~TRINITY_DN809_c0_g1_i1.p1  ORF type:complete len:154 (-),score=22.49 TRINITY_DN809_c0_g1_i1:64-525(-)
MIYVFYIYNKSGTCIYYEEWNRKKPPGNLQEEQKLMYGMLFSLKSFVSKTTPTHLGPCDSFNYFKTSTYKLHLFETASGLKFILITDPSIGDMKEQLRTIYNIYVQYVAKNPLYKPSDPIDCELFITNFQKFVQSLPSFSSHVPASPTTPSPL